MSWCFEFIWFIVSVVLFRCFTISLAFCLFCWIVWVRFAFICGLIIVLIDRFVNVDALFALVDGLLVGNSVVIEFL